MSVKYLSHIFKQDKKDNEWSLHNPGVTGQTYPPRQL